MKTKAAGGEILGHVSHSSQITAPSAALCSSASAALLHMIIPKLVFLPTPQEQGLDLMILEGPF